MKRKDRRSSSLHAENWSRGQKSAAGRFSERAENSPNQYERLDDWIVVQQGRYRYAVAETGGVLILMVLSEYLACEAAAGGRGNLEL